MEDREKKVITCLGFKASYSTMMHPTRTNVNIFCRLLVIHRGCFELGGSRVDTS